MLELTAPKNANITLKYELPQRFYSFYKINTIGKYAFEYVFQAPFAIINNFCQASMDCLTLTVTYHLCGQLAVLTCRINEVGHKETESVKYYIGEHQRLLRFILQYQFKVQFF